MKLFFRYLRERRRTIGLYMAPVCIYYGSAMLYQLPLEALRYPTVLCLLTGLLCLAGDFLRVKREHEKLSAIRSIIDFSAEELPDTIGASDYGRIFRLLEEEHREFKAETERKYADMIDYYTAWAHQIKTPIASMDLSLQHEDSPLGRKLSMELRRIEQYVQMVLTFLRLDSESTDYVIRECDLDRLIRQTVRKFSYEFIGRRIRFEYEPVQAAVITDEKWLSFVLEQVLSNALKYTQSGSIAITMDENRKLHIRDTGMGIAPEDLPRIFEKGYTGFNGRADKKASGLGLYLCKRICTNLGHGISAASQPDAGTTITIDFAQERLSVE